MKNQIKKYQREAAFSELRPYDPLAGTSDFMEVTKWANGDGFDVEVAGKLSTRFQLTWGEFTLLKKLVKTLEK